MITTSLVHRYLITHGSSGKQIRTCYSRWIVNQLRELVNSHVNVIRKTMLQDEDSDKSRKPRRVKNIFFSVL